MILFVSGEYPPDVGGVGDYTRNLRTALRDLGHESNVLARRDVGRWDARSLPRVVRSAPRDGIVHIQFQSAAYELLGDICLAPLLLRALRPRTRVVTTFHDTRVPYLFPRAGLLRQHAVRLMARTSHLAVAADHRDLLTLGGPSARHVYVPIASNVVCCPPADYDRDRFRARLGLSPTDLAVVYFGLLNTSKGLDLLVDTFGCLARDNPRARLLVVGGVAGASDPTDRVTAARAQPRLEAFGSAVMTTGWLAPRDLSAHLLAGDVALLPYADGASGRRGSLLACAEHGLPIVTTEPAADEVAAYVHAVQPTSYDLAEGVLTVMSDRDRFRAKSLDLTEVMSWRRIASDHVELYNRLLYFGP